MADVKINIQVVDAQAKAAMKGLEQQTKKTDQAFASFNVTIKKIADSTAVFVGNLKTQAFNAVINNVKALGSSFVETAIEIDTLKNKLITLTGTAQQAAKAFEVINKIDDESPFELETVATATQRLLALGLTVTDLEPTLRTLGDIATASGANLEELALSFGKVSQSGQLTSRELSSFTNNSIPLLGALASNMGITEAAAKKLANEGKIGFGEFQKALEKLTQEGGFAFGAMERQSQTLEGRIKAVSDTFEQLRIEIGAKLEPVLKVLLTAFNDSLKTLTTYIEKNVTLSDVISTTRKFLTNLIDVIFGAALAFHDLATTVAFVGGALGMVAQLAIRAAEGIAHLVAAADRMAGLEGADESERFAENLTKLRIATDAGKEALDKYVLSSEQTTKSIEATHAAVQAKIKSALDSIDVEKTEAELLKKKEDDAKAFAEAEAKRQAELLAKRREQLEEQAKLEKEQADKKAAEDELKRQTQLQKQADFHAAQLEQKAAADILEYQQQLTQDGILTEQEELQLETFKYNQEQKVLSEQLADQTRIGNKQKALALEAQIIDAAAKRDFDAAKKAGEAKKKLEENVATARENIVKQSFQLAATLAKQGSKEQFAIQKAAALAEILIGRGKALALIPAQTATIPYPANLAAAAQMAFYVNLQAGLGAAIVAASAIQGFQDGGIVGGSSFSGDNVPARVNSGEMILNREQQANLFAIANNGGGSGGQVIQINNVIELDGEVVGRSVSRQVANGLKLGEVV
jgi:tape measure domain-containing protein